MPTEWDTPVSSREVTDAHNEYIYTKTSSFTGDGAYSVKATSSVLENGAIKAKSRFVSVLKK